MYKSGGDCCGVSTSVLKIRVTKTTSSTEAWAAAVGVGAANVGWCPGKTADAFAEAIVLQQSWDWLVGLHGIEPQHRIDCWSANTGEKQSPTSRPTRAIHTSVKSEARRSIYLDFRSIKLARQGQAMIVVDTCGNLDGRDLNVFFDLKKQNSGN